MKLPTILPQSGLPNSFPSDVGLEFLSTRYDRQTLDAGVGRVYPFFVNGVGAAVGGIFTTNMDDNGQFPTGNGMWVQRLYIRAINTSTAVKADSAWISNVLATVFASSNLEWRVNDKLVGSYSLSEFLPVTPDVHEANLVGTSASLATNGQLFKDLGRLPVPLGPRVRFTMNLSVNPAVTTVANTQIEIGLWGTELRSV